MLAGAGARCYGSHLHPARLSDPIDLDATIPRARRTATSSGAGGALTSACQPEQGFIRLQRDMERTGRKVMSAPEAAAPTPGPPAHPGLREDILRAAETIFTRRDYTRWQMDDVAEACGVGKGTLYRYFPASTPCTLRSVRGHRAPARGARGGRRYERVRGAQDPRHRTADARAFLGSAVLLLPHPPERAQARCRGPGVVPAPAGPVAPGARGSRACDGRRSHAAHRCAHRHGDAARHDAGCEPLPREGRPLEDVVTAWWTSSCAGSGRRRAARSWRGLARGGR